MAISRRGTGVGEAQQPDVGRRRHRRLHRQLGQQRDADAGRHHLAQRLEARGPEPAALGRAGELAHVERLVAQAVALLEQQHVLGGEHRRGRPARRRRPAGGRPARRARSPRRTGPPRAAGRRGRAAPGAPTSSCAVAQPLQHDLGLLLDEQQLEVREPRVQLGHDVGQEVRRQRREQARCGACPTRGRGAWRAMPRMLSASPRMTRARSTTRSPASVSRTWRGLRSMSSTPSSLLELLDLGRQRRLADEARLGRPAEVAVVGHGDEVLEVAQVHGCASGRRPTPGGYGQARRGRVGDRRGGGILGGRRGADEVVEGAQRRGRPGAHGDDDLLERHGRAVAGGEHAGHRGAAPVVDHDLAARRQLDGALQPLGVGQQADLDEHAVEVDACGARRVLRSS